jgi:hypothetical protein
MPLTLSLALTALAIPILLLPVSAALKVRAAILPTAIVLRLCAVARLRLWRRFG